LARLRDAIRLSRALGERLAGAVRPGVLQAG
jgi:hypothetical protein